MSFFPLNSGWIIGLLMLTALVAVAAVVEALVSKRFAGRPGASAHGWHSRLDTAGSCLSSACAVHCLLMPIVVTAIPLGGLAFLADEAFERALVIGSLVLAGASFCWGYRRHGRWRTLLLFAAAVALLLAVRPTANETWEPIAAAMGGSALAAGHWLNRRLCRACSHCSTH